MSDPAIGQLVLLLTTIGGFIYTAWRENRNRIWASEDRRAATAEIIERATAEAQAARIKAEAIAEILRVESLQLAAKVREEARIAAEILRLETLQTAHIMRDHTLREAEAIRNATALQSGQILLKVQEGTAAAKEAQREANHVNLKIENTNKAIENLNERLLKQGEKQAGLAVETARVIEHIDDRGADTNTRVRTIETQTAPNGVKP